MWLIQISIGPQLKGTIPYIFALISSRDSRIGTFYHRRRGYEKEQKREDLPYHAEFLRSGITGPWCPPSSRNMTLYNSS